MVKDEAHADAGCVGTPQQERTLRKTPRLGICPQSLKMSLHRNTKNKIKTRAQIPHLLINPSSPQVNIELFFIMN
jgi:hypothetical protein